MRFSFFLFSKNADNYLLSYGQQAQQANRLLKEAASSSRFLTFWDRNRKFRFIEDGQSQEGKFAARDGIHLAPRGQYQLYKSLRGALLCASRSLAVQGKQQRNFKKNFKKTRVVSLIHFRRKTLFLDVDQQRGKYRQIPSLLLCLIVLISLIGISPRDTSCNRHVSSSLLATGNATVRDVGAKPSNSEAVQNRLPA